MQSEITVSKPKKPWKKITLGILSGAFFALILWFGANLLFAGKNILTENFGSGSSWLSPKADSSQLKGEGDGRINILLLGLGGANHPGGNLTDTIMLASIDPINKKIALLSIPRDLYVKIDGEYNKINYAYSYGEQHQKETGGGPAQAKKVVSDVLDLPIHYFVKMDFGGFAKIVDAIGGIDVNVEKAISDPYYPAADMKGYAPFFIKAGTHHMDGTLALKYVRSRETTSDFDRSSRQQTVIKALTAKATSLGVLTNPGKITSMISTVGTHVKTDLSVSEMNRLIQLSKELDKNNIQNEVLDNSQDGLLVSKSGSAGYFLVPKSGSFKQIQEFVHSFLSEPYLVKEAAKIEIQNGTGKSTLGKEVEEYLKNYGYQVVTQSNSPKIVSKSIIYDYTNGKKSTTLSLLKKRLNINNIETKGEGDNIDILVILGKDFKEPN